MTPQFIFGTASFAMELIGFQDLSSVKNLLKYLQGLDVHRLDSGAHYQSIKPGRTEELSATFIINTKVYIDTDR